MKLIFFKFKSFYNDLLKKNNISSLFQKDLFLIPMKNNYRKNSFFYYDNFVIINSSIHDLIKSLVKKYKSKNNSDYGAINIPFVINNGEFIFDFKNFHCLLLSDFNKNNIIYEPNLIFYSSIEEEREIVFEKLKEIKTTEFLFKNYDKHKNNIINDNKEKI